MKYRFLFTALIGIVLGFIANFINNPIILQILALISDLMLNTLLILGPVLIFLSLTNGINTIGKDWRFYLKFLAIIFISLSVGGIIFYILIKPIFPHILINNMGNMATQPKALLFYPIDIVYNFLKQAKTIASNSLPYVLFISIGCGFLLLMSKHEISNKISDFLINIEKKIFYFIQKIMMPMMPIWTISLFASITYQSAVGGLIINDAVLSIVIFVAQLIFLFIMYLLASKYTGVAIKKIINSAKNLFITTISMMGVGGNLILPYGIKAQTDVGVDEEYAKVITSSSFNLPGSLIANIGFAYGLIVIFKLNVTDAQFIIYILLLVVATILAPTLPMGVFSITQQLLHPILGFDQNVIKVMSTLYFNQGTTNAAVNNCGDVYLGLLTKNKNKK